jgi:hypothetical protein
MSNPNQYRGWNSPPATRHFVAPRPTPCPSFLPPRQCDAQANANEVEDSKAADPLIQGLVERLPKRNETWSLDERAKWLRTAASLFGLVYKASDDEQREISVVFVQANSGRPNRVMRALGGEFNG